MLLQEGEGILVVELMCLSKVPWLHKHYCGTGILLMVPSPGSGVWMVLVLPSAYEVDSSHMRSGRTEAAKDKERRGGRSNHL